MKDKRSLVLIILIVFFGAFLRFYKIDWGGGYFFHPDEYHIVNSVNQLSFPIQMNPNFFSYGSFTVYLIYFTKLLLLKLGFSINYAQFFFIGRFFSALFSTLTLVVILFLSKGLFEKNYIFLAVTILVALTPGAIQQAHFATPESSLTFWFLLTLLLLLYWSNKKEKGGLYLSAITLGIATAVKIVALIFLPTFGFILLVSDKLSLKNFFRSAKTFSALLVITAVIFILFSPYSLLDWEHFKYSLSYEGSVAEGSQIVFYTRQFINTTPVLFQLEKILPYALGPALLLFGLIGLFVLVSKVLKKSLPHSIIFFTFLLFFLSNAFLFARWTRFVAPTFPFFAIFTGFLIEKLENINKKRLAISVTLITVTTTTIWSIMFFSIYLKSDIRVSASDWVQGNIKPQSFILTEARNMLEVPLTGNYRKITFDFYDLDQNPQMLEQLVQSVSNADYFIIQGRRIYKNYQRLPDQYPLVNNFYSSLFDGKLGFTKLIEFTSYPQISLANFTIEIPDEDAEETWTVFDHPRIMIFKKEYKLPDDKLTSILKGK